MVNVERMSTTLRVVNLFPERHDQAHWACGTSRCFAGFAIDLFREKGHFWGNGGSLFEEIDGPQVFSDNRYFRIKEDEFVSDHSFDNYAERLKWTRFDDKEYRWLDARVEAVDILDIGHDDADALFNADNELDDVNEIASSIIKGEPYNCGPECPCSRHYDPCPCGCNDVEYSDDDDDE